MLLGGPRPRWVDLPAALRVAVEHRLSGLVVHAESRPGGFSPGTADRVVLDDGRRAFVKTASAEVNARTVAMHRREAQVLAVLAGSGAAPTLLALVDEPPWIALVVEDIDGRHPDPVRVEDTRAVLDAVAALPRAHGDVLARVEDELRPDSTAWARMLADGSTTVPPALASALDGLARRAPEALRGDGVVHLDLRIDNVLLDAAGRARLVDWPSAVRGARWIDGITYLLDLRTAGAPVRPRHPLLDDVDSEAVDALLALLGGYFLDAARRPPPPGIPGVRAAQQAQGDTVVDWLLERRPDLG